MLFGILAEINVKPTYAQVVQWRQVLKRLSYFVQLADFLILEILHRLVKTALHNLLHCIVESFEAGTDQSASQVLVLFKIVFINFACIKNVGYVQSNM